MKPISIALLFGMLPLAAIAEDEIFSTADGAIRGYDPVAYFEDGRPERGSDQWTFDWEGAVWHFSSQAHRDAFAADPLRFAPQFGGYCAYGLSQGYKVSIDPTAFAIVDGKLYLNYSHAVQNTWNIDRQGYIVKASQQWLKLEHSAFEPEGD